MKEITLKRDGRLMTVASYVRNGSAVADIGSDHAYLPIMLVKNGIVSRALASDVVDGPVKNARENVNAYGLDGCITVKKADGLDGIEDFAPDDIIIAGMGGELTAAIIERSEYVKNERIRLILQPMTRAEMLRGFLAESGFDITDETLCEEDGRVYQVICCHYDGQKHTYTAAELYCGKHILKKRQPFLKRHIEKTASKLRDRINGLAAAGKTAESEEKILCELTNYIKDLTN